MHARQSFFDNINTLPIHLSRTPEAQATISGLFTDFSDCHKGPDRAVLFRQVSKLFYGVVLVRVSESWCCCSDFDSDSGPLTDTDSHSDLLTDSDSDSWLIATTPDDKDSDSEPLAGFRSRGGAALNAVVVS